MTFSVVVGGAPLGSASSRRCSPRSRPTPRSSSSTPTAAAAGLTARASIERHDNPGFGPATTTASRAATRDVTRPAEPRHRRRARRRRAACDARAGREALVVPRLRNADGSIQRSAFALPGRAVGRAHRADARTAAPRALALRRAPRIVGWALAAALAAPTGAAAPPRAVRPGRVPLLRGHGPLPARPCRGRPDGAAPRGRADAYRRRTPYGTPRRSTSSPAAAARSSARTSARARCGSTTPPRSPSSACGRGARRDRAAAASAVLRARASRVRADASVWSSPPPVLLMRVGGAGGEVPLLAPLRRDGAPGRPLDDRRPARLRPGRRRHLHARLQVGRSRRRPGSSSTPRTTASRTTRSAAGRCWRPATPSATSPTSAPSRRPRRPRSSTTPCRELPRRRQRLRRAGSTRAAAARTP